MTPAERRAWLEFVEALRELGQLDSTRARLYLEGAGCSLRSWTRALRSARVPGRRSTPSRSRDAG